MTVTLHTGYSGKGKSLVVKKNIKDLKNTKIDRNQATSITVTGGSSVVLFKNTDYSGDAAFIKRSVANLKDTPFETKDKNFHKKVESVLVIPLRLSISAKIILDGKKFPGSITSVQDAKNKLNSAITALNKDWGDILIDFLPVTRVYKIYESKYFNVKTDGPENKKARNIQRDPTKIDIVIVNKISTDTIGKCSFPKSLKNLGIIVEADSLSATVLAHEFGHHFGLKHVTNKDMKFPKSNLMFRTLTGSDSLTKEQVSLMHKKIGNRRPKYTIKYDGTNPLVKTTTVSAPRKSSSVSAPRKTTRVSARR